ncbi:MAG: helix-turn-helix transcriptional regulator [Parasphingopyxis sp.]
MTDSQKACLRKVGQGMTSKEIARELELTPSTVDTYVTHAIAQLGASDRRDAARRLARCERSEDFGSQPLAVASGSSAAILSSSQRGSNSTHKRLFGLPPIGGETNELDWSARQIAIFKVGAFGIIVIVGLTLVIAGLLWVFE